jgi:hypothetical protein
MSMVVDVARKSQPTLLLLVVVKLSKVGFVASGSAVKLYEARSAARVLPAASQREPAGILIRMLCPAGYFCVPVSDMVMTCREIEVTIENVIEALVVSTSVGAVVPALYSISSSKYNVTVASVRIPVAPLPGTMDVW